MKTGFRTREKQISLPEVSCIGKAWGLWNLSQALTDSDSETLNKSLFFSEHWFSHLEEKSNTYSTKLVCRLDWCEMGGYKHSYLQVNYEITRNPDSTTNARTLILIYHNYQNNTICITCHTLQSMFTWRILSLMYIQILSVGIFFAHSDSYSGNFGGNSN